MSNADEILKLKQLLDSNLITKEEFEKAKIDILNNNTTDSKQRQVQTQKVNTYTPKKTMTKSSNNSTGCLIAFIVTFLIFTFIGVVIFISMIAGTPKKDSETEIKEFLINEYDFSEKEAETVIETINKCGFSDYYDGYTLSKGIDNKEIKGSKGFEIKQNNKVIGFVDIKKDKVCLIQYSDKILYEDGKVKHTLSEYLIKSDEKSALITRTQEVIKSILKSPSTAKFPWDYNEWAVGKENGSTIVQGYVDSQNGFGAMVRSKFQVTYKNNTVTSLIFDGKEYMN